MESLYTTYRPQTFEQVVGQKHVVETLSHAIQEHKLGHAYLFCGPRGTGKTTMARLLAKALACEHPHHGMPCGECAACQMIAAGEHPDVIEMDAASRTGVDAVRDEIISHVDYAPQLMEHKVYIIDEVHQLTKQSFNALLKTLEEPPAHVMFILCTTNPEMILPTVLSRVQRFDFRSITSSDIADYLRFICEKEGFEPEAGALDMVVQYARGGMRDALTCLEQLATFGQGKITLENARQLLGATGTKDLAEFVSAIATHDSAQAFVQLSRLSQEGRDLVQLARDLAQHLRNLYVYKMLEPKGNTSLLQLALTGVSTEELDGLGREAAQFGSAELLNTAIDTLHSALLAMRNSAHVQLDFEVALSRMCHVADEKSYAALLARLDELEAKLAQGVSVATPQPVEQMPAQVMSTATPVAAPIPAPEAAPAPATHVATHVPASVPAPAPAPMPAQPAAPTVQAVNAGELAQKWEAIKEIVQGVKPSYYQLIKDTALEYDDGSVIKIQITSGSSFVYGMLGRPTVTGVLQDAIAQVIGPRRYIYELVGTYEPHHRNTVSQVVVPPPVPTAVVPHKEEQQQNQAPEPFKAAAPQAAPQAAPVQAPAQAPHASPAPQAQAQAAPAPVAPAAPPVDDSVPYEDIYADDAAVADMPVDPAYDNIPQDFEEPAPAPAPAPTAPAFGSEAPVPEQSAPAPDPIKKPVQMVGDELPQDIASIAAAFEKALGGNVEITDAIDS